ncbi:hypothetical protein Gotur_015772 [Gossypium turneri]
MAGEFIRLDHKHISVEQIKMSVDRVLQCYIHNISGPPSPLIENYLREAGFWHVANIGRDAHIPSSMQRVYHHFGGRAVTIGIADGWVRTHRVRSIY